MRVRVRVRVNVRANVRANVRVECWAVRATRGSRCCCAPVVLVEVAVVAALVLRHVDAPRRLDAQLGRKLGRPAEALLGHCGAHLREEGPAPRRARLERRGRAQVPRLECAPHLRRGRARARGGPRARVRSPASMARRTPAAA